MTSQPTPLRERTRRAVRAELIAVAMDLFTRQGYNATTVEEIATAAGLSKRSFFRYFGSKEELLLGNQDAVGQQLEEALRERPLKEPPWLALRRAFDGIVARIDGNPHRSTVLLRLLNENTALRAAQLERRARWRTLLAPHIAQRLQADSTAHDSTANVELRALAIVSAALACYEAAQTAWLGAEATIPMARLLDEAMSSVAPLPSA